MDVDLGLPGGARVASPGVVRIAGLPADALRRLRHPESFALASTIERLACQLDTDGATLADALHGIIGAQPSGEMKASLVGLRRAVFQRRMPRERAWNATMAATLPGNLTVQLAGWISALRTYKELTCRLPTVLAAEIEAGYPVLRDIVRDPSFQRALSQSSPTLSGEVAKWLADMAHRPQRQSLIRLAKYVARAAAKTSPFSTFTSNGVANWTTTGIAARLARPGPVRVVLELDGYWRQHLVAAYSADARLSSGLRLRVNPSATVDGDTIRYLGRPPAEPIVTIPATTAIRRCLDIVGGSDGLTRAQVCKRLVDDRGDGDEVARFVEGLVALGLLHRQPPVADLTPDPLGALADWLAADGASGLADDAALVNRVRSLLGDPAPVHDVAAHAVRQRALEAAIGGLLDRVRVAPNPAIRLVHETAVLPGTAAELSLSCWRPALADLDILRHAFAAVDSALPYRIALADYCAERFGPGCTVPLLTLHEAVGRELIREDGPGRDAAARDLAALRAAGYSAVSLHDRQLPRLRALARIRDDLYRTLRTADAVDHVLHVDPQALRRLAAGWPAWIGVPPSVAFYLQAVPGEPVRLVVNAAHIGHGRGRSRALHLIRQACGSSPDVDLDTPHGGPLAAEIDGLFASALNVRIATARYEIDYPFTVGYRNGRKSIPVRDLRVVHNPVTGLVQLAAAGLTSEVRVLHLGMMADALLPPAARMLTRAFGHGYYHYTGWPMPPPESLGVPTDVVATERIEVGRVVVRRAQWLAPTSQVPLRGRGELDATYLLRLVAWLRRYGIPECCFVRAVNRPQAPTDGRQRGPATWLFDKSRKPVYVDFANWYLVKAFDRMVAAAGPVIVLEEALPAPESAAGANRLDGRVSEFIVELGGPAVRGA